GADPALPGPAGAAAPEAADRGAGHGGCARRTGGHGVSGPPAVEPRRIAALIAASVDASAHLPEGRRAMAVVRKQRGHFLEDFHPGDVYRHKGGKTITEGLFALFTDFSMTTNPLSKNARYARAYGFEGLVVPPGLVMLVVFSQSVEDVSENARANLEYIDMRFGAPVYIGDTLEAETRVLGVKGSSSNPMLGVVHVQTTGRNQRGEVVLTFQRKVQVWKRDTDAALHEHEVEPERIDTVLGLPAYDPARRYGELAHLTNADSYLEDFTPGDVIEHSRGRVVTTDHVMLTGILDNTSQVHCNQWMVSQ